MEIVVTKLIKIMLVGSVTFNKDDDNIPFRKLNEIVEYGSVVVLIIH